ncbi:RagB/SusD family nutrient uptake outer membrane protein [Niabella sp.]|uniref:RagB/SusD family nutrient uptake outer membrane protein n=1 Tax=Niabella sp. TaxID=1962976 RepID=UPI002626361A|nr:RagB/SusD family nutrient uptake outer membrane protein [Niabella sp.]
MYIKKIIVFLSLAALVFQSCSKLDTPPSDYIDPTKAFRNLDDLNMGVLGAYAPLSSTLIENVAIVSDEAMLPTENTVSNTSAHRWLYNSTSGSVTSAFYEYCVAIDRANRVLEAVPNIPAYGAQSRLDQYQAEMLALRAYAYLELLSAYASSYEPDGMGLPYVKKPTLEYLARERVKSNFDNMNADLKAARELMPSGFSDNSRITKAAISAIQARVALYEKKWTDAIAYASEVIASEPLAPKNDFAKVWKDSSQAEVVWKLARVRGDSRIGGIFFRETGEIVLYAPSFKLIDQFGTPTQRADDVRFSSYIQYAPTRPAGKSQYLVNKYVGGDSAYRGLTAVKLFRTGEMYLIRAEAALENNDLAAAAKDLNDLRRGRIYNYIDQTFTDKQSLMNAIYNERFKELAFEGHRFFDLKRRNLPVERTTQDAINTSGAVKLMPTAAQYCFPIPADEMAVNKKMIQNPNY